MDKEQEQHLSTIKQDLTRYPADDFPRRYPMPTANRADYSSGDDDESVDVQKYLTLALRHWKLITVSTLLGLTLAVWVTKSQTPIYQAQTSVEIQGTGDTLGGREKDVTNSGDIETQAKLIQSGSMRARVIRKLESPETKPAPKLVHKGRALFRQNPRSLPRPNPPAKVSIWPTVKSLFLPQAPPSPLGMAAATLKVAPVKETRFIEITCDSTDPDVAADFVNTLVSEFIEQRMEDRWEAYNTTGQWLTRAQEELKLKLEASEQRLQEYARSSGLLFTGEDRSVAEEKLRQLQDELSKAEADRIQKEAKYNLTVSSSPESLPEVLDNGPLAQYQVKLADLRRELALLTSSLTPAHPKVVRLQAQIAELESTLLSERQNVVRRLKNEYQSAQERERAVIEELRWADPGCFTTRGENHSVQSA